MSGEEKSLTALREGTRKVSTDAVTLVVAILGYAGFLRLLTRYGPAYVVALGGSALAVGAFGVIVYGSRLLYPHLSAETDDVVGGDLTPGLALGSALGLLLWVLAPGLGGADGVLPAWIWVLAGALLVQLWPTLGRKGSLKQAREKLSHRPLLSDVLEMPFVRRAATVVPVGLGLGVFLLVPQVLPGLEIIGGLGAAVGVTVAIVALSAVGETGEVTSRRLLPGAAVVDALRALPDRLQTMLFADMLVYGAVAVSATFAATLVITVKQPALRMLWFDLHPEAAFAVFLGAEIFAAAGAPAVGRALDDFVAPRTVFTLGLLMATLFPVVLVLLPPTLWAGTFAFKLFGLRRIADPARETMLEAVDGRPERSYRKVRRAAAPVAVVVGAFLYALSPRLTFEVAGFVAAVGLLERFRDSQADYIRKLEAVFDR